MNRFLKDLSSRGGRIVVLMVVLLLGMSGSHCRIAYSDHITTAALAVLLSELGKARD